MKRFIASGFGVGLFWEAFFKNKKYLWTFASYEENDELFSDRNVFPLGCVTKMEKISER